MKYLIESGDKTLKVHRESESIILDLNGEKIALEGVNLEEFDNLIGNLSKDVYNKLESETPIIKKVQRIWKGKP